jgi:hypothetical protein
LLLSASFDAGGPAVNRQPSGTIFLVILTDVVGLAMIAAGLWGGARLMSERSRIEIPLRYYAIVLGIVGSGIGLLGIAQALRLLLMIQEGVWEGATG